MKTSPSARRAGLSTRRLPRAVHAESVIELELQRRDPGTGEIRITPEKVDPAKVGIVVIDMWNFHWCKTSTARVAAMVPRMNRVLEQARALGMQVFMCPTDVADNYVGTPQREAVFAIERLPLPQLAALECPPAPDGGGCTCGPVRCRGNYGWDGLHPDLKLDERDLMPNDFQVLYSLCKQRGLTHLIFMGVHTQVCLLGKSVGLANMTKAGFRCMLARDLTDAHGLYDPVQGIRPDDFTATVVAHFEKHLTATINMADEMKKLGRWDEDWRVDPVRVAPWGLPNRPHLFEKEVVVTLTFPGHTNASIHYTLDGTAPTPLSPRYTVPLKLTATTELRTAAYAGARPVSLGSVAYFACLPPLPLRSDVHLSDLKPLRAVGPGHSPSDTSHRFSPGSSPPQMNLTNRKQPLRLRHQKYERGVGVHAPNQMIYALKPDYERFVALAGVDEYIVDESNGSNLGMYPSVIFKVFIDGKLAAASPVMRLLEEPWRFDVRIPPGSKQISLVVTDAGNGNREDLANWVNAGFVVKR
jgi:nicotinamidase-related amidase